MENGGNTEEWQEIQRTSRTELFAICKYKKIIRSRVESYVTCHDIENAYNNNNITNLQSLLNNLFLEYHTEQEIDNLLKLMKETKTSITEIYQRHVKRPEMTILAHLNM